jgi:hypothetical protein
VTLAFDFQDPDGSDCMTDMARMLAGRLLPEGGSSGFTFEADVLDTIGEKETRVECFNEATVKRKREEELKGKEFRGRERNRNRDKNILNESVKEKEKE